MKHIFMITLCLAPAVYACVPQSMSACTQKRSVHVVEPVKKFTKKSLQCIDSVLLAGSTSSGALLVAGLLQSEIEKLHAKGSVTQLQCHALSIANGVFFLRTLIIAYQLATPLRTEIKALLEKLESYHPWDY